MEFSELKLFDTFIIKDEFGSAGFQKTKHNKAICLDSQDGSYQVGREYVVLCDQIVIKTNN